LEGEKEMGRALAKGYRDDEYYTTEATAIQFFEKIVKPSGILEHKTLLMPFSKLDQPLFQIAKKYHDNVIAFNGDYELWQKVSTYQDVAVVDNPPFSLSVKIEQFYFECDIPFLLFRSAVSYPKFIYNKIGGGVIYENSRQGIKFAWGIGKHIQGDEYIEKHYPNLLDHLKAAGLLEKRVPVGFSFFKTGYDFKIKTVSFDGLQYPGKKDIFVYLSRGVFNENSRMWVDASDGRVHILSE
jgi:hypothetical protein